MNKLYLYLSLIGVSFSQMSSASQASPLQQHMDRGEYLIAEQHGRPSAPQPAARPQPAMQEHIQPRQQMQAPQQHQMQEMQQVQQRQGQEQQREMEQSQQRQAQEQQKQAQEQQRQVQEQQRQAQQQQQGALQAQERQQAQQREAQQGQLRSTMAHQRSPFGEQEPNLSSVGQRNEFQQPAGARPLGSNQRRSNPPPLAVSSVPLNSVLHGPTVGRNASPTDREQASQFSRSLEKHLTAVPGNQAPQNWQQIQHEQMNRLFDGRPMRINNQMIPMTPGTALLNVAPYPQWYQPLPNWQYASGFNLGSLNCGPSWLGWGWPSWCGPAPAGFFCGTDYGPTPYIYFPAAGQWREAGVFGWVDGPDEDYTGPISVEVVEPVEIPVGFNPYGGPGMEVINQVFMYDAYYFPDAGRWGYMDRHGYFIWLNI